MNSFYTTEELELLGFKCVGENVLISKKVSFYGVSRIEIGNNVRIDDFCVLSAGSGGIIIGSYVHIAVFSSLMGEGRIILNDFSGLSSRVSIYSSNDDYSGQYMTNPTIPKEFTGVFSSGVQIGKHVIIGSNSVIMPGVTLNTAVAIGAFSFVNRDCEEFSIYKGNPAKKIAERNKNILQLEMEFLRQNNL